MSNIIFCSGYESEYYILVVFQGYDSNTTYSSNKSPYNSNKEQDRSSVHTETQVHVHAHDILYITKVLACLLYV